MGQAPRASGERQRARGKPRPSWGARIPALETLQRALPAVAAAPPLTQRDVALLLQWTAPGKLLGSPPSVPCLRREDVLAVSSGDREQGMAALEDLLSTAISAAREVELSAPPEGAQPIAFFLDLPGHPEWTCGVRVGGRLELAIGGLLARASG